MDATERTSQWRRSGPAARARAPAPSRRSPPRPGRALERRRRRGRSPARRDPRGPPRARAPACPPSASSRSRSASTASRCARRSRGSRRSASSPRATARARSSPRGASAPGSRRSATLIGSLKPPDIRRGTSSSPRSSSSGASSPPRPSRSRPSATPTRTSRRSPRAPQEQQGARRRSDRLRARRPRVRARRLRAARNVGARALPQHVRALAGRAPAARGACSTIAATSRRATTPSVVELIRRGDRELARELVRRALERLDEAWSPAPRRASDRSRDRPHESRRRPLRTAARSERSDEPRVRAPLGARPRWAPSSRARAAPRSASTSAGMDVERVPRATSMRRVPFAGRPRAPAAIWLVALAPLFVLGRFATIAGLARADRERVLAALRREPLVRRAHRSSSSSRRSARSSTRATPPSASRARPRRGTPWCASRPGARPSHEPASSDRISARLSPRYEPDAQRFPDEALPEGAVVDGAALSARRRRGVRLRRRRLGRAGRRRRAHARPGGLLGRHRRGGPVGQDARLRRGRVRRLPPHVSATPGRRCWRGAPYMPLLQGRCVGGSTVVNSAIAWRTPEDVLDEWRAHFGLGGAITRRTLEPHFDALERDLNVHAVDDDVLGENNRLFLDGPATERGGARRGCTATSAAAGLGAVPHRVPERRQAGDERELRAVGALARGAHLHVVPRRAGGRAGRARGRGAREDELLRSPSEEAVAARRAPRAARRVRRGEHRADAEPPPAERRARARARGALPGPPRRRRGGSLRRAGRDAPSARRRGRRSCTSAGPIASSSRRLSMPPELAAARMPGIGTELLERLCVVSRTSRCGWSQSAPRPRGRCGRALGRRRRRSLHARRRATCGAPERACAILTERMFEAGAREVWPGIYGLPAVLRSQRRGPPHRGGAARSARVLVHRDAPLRRRAHGAGPAHERRRPRLRRPTTASGLYVVDSSVFPTNLGVNPQHSIMAHEPPRGDARGLAPPKAAASRMNAARPPRRGAAAEAGALHAALDVRPPARRLRAPFAPAALAQW